MKVSDKVMQTVQRAVLAVSRFDCEFCGLGQSATPQANVIEAIAVAGHRAGTSSSDHAAPAARQSTCRIHDQQPAAHRVRFSDTDNALGKTTQKSAMASCAI